MHKLFCVSRVMKGSWRWRCANAKHTEIAQSPDDHRRSRKERISDLVGLVRGVRQGKFVIEIAGHYYGADRRAVVGDKVSQAALLDPAQRGFKIETLDEDET